MSRRSMSEWNGLWVALTVCLLLGVALEAGAQEPTAVTGSVTSAATSEPLGNATVIVVQTQQEIPVQADGSFALELAPGRYTLLFHAPGYGTTQRQITVELGTPVELEIRIERSLSQFGDEVVVLGSRSRRTAVETPVPVDVLSGEQLTENGLVETSRILQFLAPSFNFSTSTVSDGTDIVRPSTLRGLGPDQTLVLVNGKRRHNSALVHVNGSIGRGTAGVDLNAIPSSAIERIEVLRDGAAAQYGSDAIAGVINIVLKSQTEQTEVDVQAGQHFEGDGELLQVAVNRGWRIRETGFFNLTAEVRDRGDTNRAGRDPRRIFNFLEQEFGQPALSSGTLDPREQTYDRLNHRYGDAESENVHLFFNSEVPLSRDADFYLFGGISQRDGESAGFNRLPSQSRTNILIHPEGHLPLIGTNVDDASLGLGVRKRFGGWALDASLTYGENEFQFVISNSANTSLGAASPTSADAGTLTFDQTTLNLDFLRSFDWGMAGPANLALGVEVRQDGYQIGAGETVSWIDGGVPDQFGGRAPAGIQVFPGFRPSNEVDESRENFGVYGDLELNPSPDFLLSLAARFEEYSDFGNNLSGKVAARYAVTDRFAFRGSVSTGFRAPSLHQANFNNTSTQFVLVGGELVPLEVGTFRNGSSVTRALGVPELEEETSVGYSFGFTSRPNDRLSITADAFKIDIDDRIVISGLFQASNPQIAPLLEPFGVNAAQFFTNAIDTETEGLDLVVAYALPLGDDQSLSLTAAANWSSTEVVGDVRTPAPLAGLGETLFDRRERAFIEVGQPKQLYNLSGRYSRGPFAALVRLNRFGSVTTVEAPNDPTIDQTFSAKWLTDVDFSYRLPSGIRIAVGANNVFDVFPDRNREEISFNGIFVYPRRNAPFGFNGGYYYTRLSFDF